MNRDTFTGSTNEKQKYDFEFEKLSAEHDARMFAITVVKKLIKNSLTNVNGCDIIIPLIFLKALMRSKTDCEKSQRAAARCKAVFFPR